MAAMGLKSVVNVPLLAAGGRFLGALNMAVKIRNGFSGNDILLLKAIGACLSSNLMLRRLQDAQV
jgi:hypothetical protein